MSDFRARAGGGAGRKGCSHGGDLGGAPSLEWCSAMPLALSGVKEECGVFGVWGHPQASRISYYAQHSLQHRGQEGAGQVVTVGKNMKGKTGEGLVPDIFSDQT